MTGRNFLFLVLALILANAEIKVASAERQRLGSATIEQQFNRAVGRKLAAEHDCHCDGQTEIHCDIEESEAVCHCEDGEVHCLGDDCHCDGLDVHCTGETDEAACSCEDEIMHCEAAVAVAGADCSCQDGDPHCTGGTDEDLCHCDEDAIHCEAGSSHDGGDTEVVGKPWKEVILASLIVNLCTLIGVIFGAGELLRRMFCPRMEAGAELQQSWVRNYIPMFACGALLATTFFLVLPEALRLIEGGLIEKFDGDGHEGHNHRRYLEGDDDDEGYSESMATWRWGVSVMGGFLIPAFFHAVLPHKDEDAVVHYKVVDNLEGNVFKSSKAKPNATASGQHPACTDKSVGDSTHPTGHPSASDEEEAQQKEESPQEEIENIQEEEVEDPQDGTSARKEAAETEAAGAPAEEVKVDWSLFIAISLGDFFHNFADGIFIGTAFLLCDRDIAFTIALATILHELPQEIADYFLLVHQCHFSPCFALAMNFLVGMSIMLGGIIVLAISDISQVTIGVILAMSGGVYIHISVFECFVRAEKHQNTPMQKLGGFLGFLVGVVPIGLVLLNHEHCGGH